MPIVERAPDTLINRKRNDETPETGRIVRIMQIKDARERANYSDSLVSKSPRNTEKLQTQIVAFNSDFLVFFRAEGLNFENRVRFTMDGIVLYEAKINGENTAANNPLKLKLAQVRYSRLAQSIKNIL